MISGPLPLEGSLFQPEPCTLEPSKPDVQESLLCSNESSVTNATLDEWSGLDIHALVCQAQDGRRHAFQQIYRLAAPLLFRRLLRLTGNFATAEDCLQQVFLRVVEKIHSYRGEGEFMAWINKIATNEVLQLFRTQKKQMLLMDVSLLWGRGQCSSEALPEVLFLQEEQKQLVHRMLQKLDYRKRMVVLMCDLEGQTLETVSKELGVPKGTVSSRLCHGRQELRHYIAQALKESGIPLEDWIHG